MDALLTINAGSQLADAIIPAKAPQQHDQKFGKVLNKKRQEHQPEKSTAEKGSRSTSHSKQKGTVARQQSAEKQQKPVEATEMEASGATDREDVAACDAEDKIQPLELADEKVVVTTADGDGMEGGVPLPKEDAFQIAVDVAGDVQEIEDPIQPVVTDVTELSENTDDKENSDIIDDEVPAVAVPLPAAETAVVAADATDHIAAAAVEQQCDAPVDAAVKVKPSRQQAKEVAVMPLDGNEEVVSNPQVVSGTMDDVVVSADAAGEEVDPRFSGLLKPRREKAVTQPLSPIKEPAQLHGVQKGDSLQAEAPVVVPDESAKGKPPVESVELTGLSAKQVLEQLTQPGTHQHGQGQPHVQGFEAAKAMPQTPVVQLSNGYQIPESQIFDQVVTQISGSINGESGRMVLRLQPAELGSLKLELKIEGDRVQAHLHAQTHQVQDVLERNLPQLRSALAEQGLKIDQFLVNVDQRHAEGQFDGQAQYQHQSAEGQLDWYQADNELEEQMIPLSHLMQNGGGGISLHV